MQHQAHGPGAFDETGGRIDRGGRLVSDRKRTARRDQAASFSAVPTHAVQLPVDIRRHVCADVDVDRVAVIDAHVPGVTLEAALAGDMGHDPGVRSGQRVLGGDRARWCDWRRTGVGNRRRACIGMDCDGPRVCRDHGRIDNARVAGREGSASAREERDRPDPPPPPGHGPPVRAPQGGHAAGRLQARPADVSLSARRSRRRTRAIRRRSGAVRRLAGRSATRPVR